MMQQSGPSSANPSDEAGSKRRRKPLSCEPCRHSKLRCDRQLPCAACLKRGWQDQCAYGTTAVCTESGPSPRRRRTRHSAVRAVSQQPPEQLVTPEEPVAGRDQSPEAIHHRWDDILCRPPIVQKNSVRARSTDVACTMSFGPSTQTAELLQMLPPDTICEYLVSRYFAHLCPLFHILHGPTFQKQYSAFLQDPQQVDLSWLALLFAICSLSVKTIPPTDSGLIELWTDQTLPCDLPSLSQQYRNAAMMSLSQDQFLFRHNLHTLEALLVVIHNISDSEGAEFAWALLGTATNIAIALRCHTVTPEPNYIERERRRRCWAAILILHTYQALLFRDTDLSFLCNMKTPMPVDANDHEIREDVVLTRSGHGAGEPTQMSLMRFQIRLFHLSTDICNHISGPDRMSEQSLNRLALAVSTEQQKWDSLYLVDGSPSILDTSGYAHWCILQTYAHQLYLLLHRPFHNSRSRHFRPESRERCVKSSLALMDIHRQLYELPRLKVYRWMITATISCNALHGAVALTSCLLDMPHGADVGAHIAAIDGTVQRLEKLRRSSPACSSIYPILRHLQSRLARQDPVPTTGTGEETMESRFDDWISSIDWFRPDDIGWDFWDEDFNTPQNDDSLAAPASVLPAA